MRCPGFLCGSVRTEVKKTVNRSLFIRRIRECLKCGLRFETEEKKTGKYPIHSYCPLQNKPSYRV